MIYLQKELPRSRKAALAKKKTPTPRVVSISLINPPISYRMLKTPSARSSFTFWCALKD
jgi:hypothetical protein